MVVVGKWPTERQGPRLRCFRVQSLPCPPALARSLLGGLRFLSRRLRRELHTLCEPFRSPSLSLQTNVHRLPNFPVEAS